MTATVTVSPSLTVSVNDPSSVQCVKCLPFRSLTDTRQHNLNFQLHSGSAGSQIVVNLKSVANWRKKAPIQQTVKYLQLVPALVCRENRLRLLQSHSKVKTKRTERTQTQRPPCLFGRDESILQKDRGDNK